MEIKVMKLDWLVGQERQRQRNREREGERESDRERETEGERERQTDRQRQREIDREREKHRGVLLFINIFLKRNRSQYFAINDFSGQ